MLKLSVKKTRKGLLFVDPDGDKHFAENPQEAWHLLHDLAGQEAEVPTPLARRELQVIEAEVVAERRAPAQTITAERVEEPLDIDIEGAVGRGLSNVAASAIVAVRNLSKKHPRFRGRRRCRNTASR